MSSPMYDYKCISLTAQNAKGMIILSSKRAIMGFINLQTKRRFAMLDRCKDRNS